MAPDGPDFPGDVPPVPRTDYDRMAPRYEAGRSLPDDGMQAWREALSTYLPPAGSMPILDLGSGTGIWTRALARWFNVWVIGVEPSEGMRAIAEAAGRHPLVAYVAGRAEHLPLGAGSVGAAMLSTVIHHFSDVDAAVAELHRVLTPGAPVLLRSAFRGRTEGIAWLRYFPEAEPLAQAQWPRVDDVVDAFARGGFTFGELQSIPQVSALNLRDYRDRIRHRADSTLAVLDDEAFRRGMAALERAAGEEGGDDPVIVRLDLLVLIRSGDATGAGHP
jgi:ubiquinone/menaquinone biosynthesis C-methylase UbiE